jgi:nicotinamidase-related amidase/type 1 glutamine amidotransferase
MLRLSLVFALGLSLPALHLPTDQGRENNDRNAFQLHLRYKIETEPESGRYHTLTKTTDWKANKTALIICDMWDKHWCPGATARVGELAPRMNLFIAEARKRGALIIHCPSETMEFYKDHPGRKLAQAAPKVAPKVPLQNWCGLMAKREGALPIDDSDGGCAETTKSYQAWTRQHPAIEIASGDAITDSAEAYYLLRQRSIENVMIMGVHTNMCVLGRPFGIRQQVQQGLNVVLVRDLTDTMYNPARRPLVSHFTGTDLVVDHIEKHWCPTINSADLLGGKEFRFAEDHRKHLLILAAEDEYQTEKTLPPFALKQLGHDFRVTFVFADAKERHRLPGLEAIKDADVALISVRRRPLVKEQLDLIRQFVASGKPVVAIRTASHAFARKGDEKLPEGVDEWKRFDLEVLGCNYQMHHDNELHAAISMAPDMQNHAILKDISTANFVSGGSLYKSKPLHQKAITLLNGTIANSKGGSVTEPVAWIYTRPDGGRTFYTSLGHAKDFENPNFVTLLRTGIYWAAGIDAPKSDRP